MNADATSASIIEQTRSTILPIARKNLSFPRKHRRSLLSRLPFLRKDEKRKEKKKMEKRSLQPPIGRVEMEFGRSVVGAAKSVEGRIASIRGIVRVEAKKRPGVSA